MSHISRLKTRMVEKKHLLQALKDLGYEYEEGDLEVRGTGGKTVKVEIRVPLRLSSDIGFNFVDGSFEMVADWWSVRDLKQQSFSRQLLQRYAYHATCEKLEEQGFSLAEEQQQKNGQIRLVLRRMV